MFRMLRELSEELSGRATARRKKEGRQRAIRRKQLEFPCPVCGEPMKYAGGDAWKCWIDGRLVSGLELYLRGVDSYA